MAEEDLKKAILEKIQREKQDILALGEKEKELVLQQARDEAFILREGYLEKAQKIYSLKRALALNQIELEAKRKILEAKEKKISQVFSQVQEKLKEVHQEKSGYKVIFRGLLEESLKALDKKVKVKLKVNPSDREIALGVLKGLGLDAQLETKDSIDAGLELCDLEENVSILNTFQSRFNKLIPQLRQRINEILFG